MATKPSRFGFTPREHRVSVLPSTVASMLLLALTVLSATLAQPAGSSQRQLLMATGAAGIVYLAVFNLLIMPSPSFRPAHAWLNSFLAVAGLCILNYTLPDSLDFYTGFLLILAVITSSIAADRAPTYALILLATLGNLAL
ncbi:MAG: hypothetical protein ACM3QS_01230, partial [Bacteroidota bacterium]